MLNLILKNKLSLTALIYLSAFGIANAQSINLVPESQIRNEPTLEVCSEKAKIAARRIYGMCLGDQKTKEMKGLKVTYRNQLKQMQQSYESELKNLRQERDQLRRGIIPKTQQAQQTQKTNSSIIKEDLSQGESGQEDFNQNDSKLSEQTKVLSFDEIKNQQESESANTTQNKRMRFNTNAAETINQDASSVTNEISPNTSSENLDLPEPETL